ncbi:TlpA family protein disulfide reductase [Antarcticibacterium sp. 1MA-6-2]|uniref:TlpA family protein disulfide reductase n=1 Tax=Antarcticibacterium sp. 1MA-6-2 TaxID=2908210 RepID=UPI001F380C6E|nr:TlpA disulfide reductase family protein [Antarcticibacterium sp. 1MA-6-2]UJH92108.1 TlpA family protein disulfide reductase [Antarcticibacterium sp. 1MA-6-2]
MKTLVFTILFCIFFIEVPAKTKVQVVDNPSYDLATTKRFRISKIELSEKETKVHLEWSIPEGWWIQYAADTFLKNPETGEKFTVIKIEDEEFDTRIDIGASGTHHSIFIFPPLEKGIEKIDYNDQFYGLYLNGKKPQKSSEVPENMKKWMDTELAKVKKDPLQDYESDKFFSKEPAKIIGYIKGYDSRLGFETGIYYASNELTREEYPVTIEIYEDGRFEADIPLIHPTTSYIVFNNRILNFYLEPGHTLGMVLDWKDFLEAEHKDNIYYAQAAIEFKGRMAEINKNLSQFQFPQFDYDEYQKNRLSLSAEEFKKYVFNFREENKKKLDAFLKHSEISGNAEWILRNENKLQGVIMMMNYLRDRDYYQRQNPENEYLKEKIGMEFYSFLQDLPLNERALLINKNFGEFINQFEFTKPLSFHPKETSFTPEITELEYLEKQSIKITEEERKLLAKKIFYSQEEVMQNMKDRMEFREKYGDQIKEYADKYISPYIADFKKSTDYMDPWHKKDSVMVNHFKLKNDLIYDITKTRNLKSILERITEADEAHHYWKDLSATIENDFLKKEGERIVKKKFPGKKKTADGANPPSITLNFEIIPLLKGKAKDLFYDIADQYRGKILFIDFWATSCGPCVATIKEMKGIRKTHENNPDIEFVFITDEAQSPLEYYNKFTKEQEMTNIHRVNTDTYNRFRQLFQFNGIPRYVVLNKKGELIDGNFPMHNFTSKLPDILEKNK